MIKRSNESEFLDSVFEKLAAKKQYTIMGASPGDGGVYWGESPEEVVALYLKDNETYDSKADAQKEFKKNLKKIIEDTKAGKYHTDQQLRDYEEAWDKHNKDSDKFPKPELLEDHLGLHELEEGVWEWGTYEVKLVH